jgi:phospholipid/cholesterol/gamma-HCH transport system substrate-binding protein
MRRDNINYFTVGLFVIAMGVALVALLFAITGRTGPTERYHVFYHHVGGIKHGTPVLYQGFQVGQVERVTPDRAGGELRYRVEFGVTRGWSIPADSIAKVVASGLLSAVVIDISNGTSRTMLAPGTEVAGQDQINLFATLTDLAANFTALSDSDLRPLLRNLNARITELSQEYKDLSAVTMRPFVDALHKQLDDPQFFAHLKAAAAKLDDSASELRRLLGDENQAHLSATLANLDAASTDLVGLMQRLEQTRAKLHSALTEIDGLVAENRGPTKESIEMLRASLDEVSLRIGGIMYHLDGSARNLHEFSRQVRESPGVLLKSNPPKATGRD